MKNEKNKKLELGRELAQQREDKGLSIAQLSDRTKIAVRNITHIENGVFDFLPSAYVKAYLSAIAVELGLDSGVILRKYYASFVRDVDEPAHETKSASPRKGYTEPVAPQPEKSRDEIAVNPPENAVPEKTEEQVTSKIVEKPLAQPETEPDKSRQSPLPKKQGKKKPAVDKREGHLPALEAREAPPPYEAEKPVADESEKPLPAAAVEKVSVEKVDPQKSRSSWFDEFKLVLRFYSVFILGVLFLAFALVVIFWIVPDIQLRKKVQEVKALIQPLSVQEDTLTQVIQPLSADTLSTATAALPIPVKEKTPEPVRQLLSLKIEVSDSAWLRIVYNDSLAEEGIFAPGEEKTWQGYENFYMRIGNAGGIHLFLDGKFLGPLPQSGIITNIQINKDGFKTIKKTQFPDAMGVSVNQ